MHLLQLLWLRLRLRLRLLLLQLVFLILFVLFVLFVSLRHCGESTHIVASHVVASLLRYHHMVWWDSFSDMRRASGSSYGGLLLLCCCGCGQLLESLIRHRIDTRIIRPPLLILIPLILLILGGVCHGFIR